MISVEKTYVTKDAIRIASNGVRRDVGNSMGGVATYLFVGNQVAGNRCR